jgi:hypothetical protein
MTFTTTKRSYLCSGLLKPARYLLNARIPEYPGWITNERGYEWPDLTPPPHSWNMSYPAVVIVLREHVTASFTKSVRVLIFLSAW